MGPWSRPGYVVGPECPRPRRLRPRAESEMLFWRIYLSLAAYGFALRMLGRAGSGIFGVSPGPTLSARLLDRVGSVRIVARPVPKPADRPAVVPGPPRHRRFELRPTIMSLSA